MDEIASKALHAVTGGEQSPAYRAAYTRYLVDRCKWVLGYQWAGAACIAQNLAGAKAAGEAADRAGSSGS